MNRSKTKDHQKTPKLKLTSEELSFDEKEEEQELALELMLKNVS
jgi:hypothetical protein